MKLPTLALFTASLMGTVSALAQSGNMMNGGWMGGMVMMKEMHGGMQGMSATGESKAMPADMAKRRKLMADRMASMQMMMNMMANRVPPATP